MSKKNIHQVIRMLKESLEVLLERASEHKDFGLPYETILTHAEQVRERIQKLKENMK